MESWPNIGFFYHRGLCCYLGNHAIQELESCSVAILKQQTLIQQQKQAP